MNIDSRKQLENMPARSSLPIYLRLSVDLSLNAAIAFLKIVP
ncbi:MAG: hypothetical protein ACRC2R_23825 [Xenococcaceae cyanobacterium]